VAQRARPARKFPATTPLLPRQQCAEKYLNAGFGKPAFLFPHAQFATPCNSCWQSNQGGPFHPALTI